MDVVYRFIATGAGSVESAFLGIETAAKRSKKATEEAARSTTKAAGAGRSGGKSPNDRAYAEAEKLAAKIEREDARDAKSAKRAADARIREAQRASDYVGKIRDRHFASEQRAEEKSERAKAKAAERISADRYRTLGRLAKDASLAALTGGFAASMGIVGSAAREGVALNDASNRLSISARGAGETGADPATLRREFQAAALQAPGVKASDIAEGVQGFVAKTGDLKSGRAFASTFATTASATGSSVQDIANAAADISQKFDIKSIDEMRDALAALTFQGKNGAFELKDAASQFAKMSAAASRFGLDKGVGGLKTLGGLSQIARSSTGSPEQAATAVEAMFRQIISKSAEFESEGVQVFKRDSKGRKTNETRGIQDFLTDAISKGHGNLAHLQKKFGDEGIRGISPLISTYNETVKGTSGTEAQKTAAGVEALREALAKAIDAPGDWAEVVKDAAQAQQGAGAQLDAAWQSVVATVSDQAVPALLSVVPKIAGLADAIDPAITIFVALVEAAGLLVDVMKFLGIAEEKKLNPQQKLDKAKKELGDYQAKLDKRTHMVTPEEAKEKWRLQDAVKAAEAVATTTTDVAHGKKTTSMTPEEFAKQYTDASGESFGTEGRRADAEYKAKKLAAEIQASPNMLNPGGENDAQQAIREKFAADATYENNRTDKGGAPSGQGIKDLDAAAAAAAKALQQIQAANQPSIAVGG